MIIERGDTKVTLENAEDLKIILNGSEDIMSQFIKGGESSTLSIWYILTPLIAYMFVNIFFIFSSNEKWIDPLILKSTCIFIMFILSGVTSYFIYIKNNSITLSLSALVFLILVSSAVVGLIKYSDITNKAMQKTSSVIGGN